MTMPMYVYETLPSDPKKKPRRFEIKQGMTEEPLKTDPETGEPVRRVISGGLGLLQTKGIEPSPMSQGHSCGNGMCGCRH